MRISDMHYILEVARCSSISAAANKLFVAQTTLSSIVNSVESKLDMKIFNRTHRGVNLTPKGEKMIALIEQIVGQYDILTSLSSEENLVNRHIDLIAYPSACDFLGPILANKIKTDFTNVIFNVHEVTSQKIVSKVAAGIAPVAIGSSSKYEYFKSKNEAHQCGLEFENLFTDHFSLCVNENSEFANRDSVNIEELKYECLATSLHYIRSDKNSVGFFHKFFNHFNVLPSIGIIKTVVQKCDMIAILPGLVINDDNYADKKLVKVHLTGFETELENYLVYGKSSRSPTLQTYLIDSIREFYKSLA